VPKPRTDDAYFAPLDGLKLHPETEIVSAQPTPWKKNAFVSMVYETREICVS
jgi:hypothetical protein